MGITIMVWASKVLRTLWVWTVEVPLRISEVLGDRWCED